MSFLVVSTPSSPICQIIDDPSGNSFVENPHAPQKDHALVITHYNRTAQQEELLGLQVSRPTRPEEWAGITLLSGLLGISASCFVVAALHSPSPQAVHLL